MTQLSTTAISEHFGVTLSARFVIDTLGVPNDGKLKAAILWNEDKLPVIGKALIKHVKERAEAAAAEKHAKPPKTPAAAELTDDDLGL